MARTPEGNAWARFLIRQREGRGWSQQRAFEELHEVLGYSPRSRASYRGLEEGRVPEPTQQKALIDFYGSGPAEIDYTEPATPGIQPSLSEAIVMLVDELREMRLERQTLAEEVQALKGAVALLGRRSAPGSEAPGPRQAKAGSVGR